MSTKQHESVLHRIGFNSSVSSPAPAHQGARHGYFDDTVTKCLLQLSDEEVLLNAGTYGSKELGQFPIKMPFVRDGDYNQCLMPFVPQHHTYYRNQLTLHNQNGQWIPLVTSIMALWNIFSEIVADALKLAECMGLSVMGTLIRDPFPLCSLFISWLKAPLHTSTHVHTKQQTITALF